MRAKKWYQDIWLLLTVMVIIVIVCLQHVWIVTDTSVEGTDSQNHLMFSLNFFQWFSKVTTNSTYPFWIRIVKWFQLLSFPASGTVYWPNGLYFITAFCYTIFGCSLYSAKLSLLAYLVLLLGSVYMLGRMLYASRVGFFAVCILYMYPMIFESARQYQLDFPLTAMVALNMLLLIRCDFFRARWTSVLFGVAFGWGMLIKGQLLLFLIWPLSIVVLQTIGGIIRGGCAHCLRSRQLYNMAIFCVIAYYIAGIWWGLFLPSACEALRVHIFEASKAIESHWIWTEKYSLKCLMSHCITLFDSLSPMWCIVFLISSMRFFRLRGKQFWCLSSWLVCPFILFSVAFTIKHPRFLMPIFPVMALISADMLSRLKGWKGRIVVASVFLFGTMQFYGFSYTPYVVRSFMSDRVNWWGCTDYDTAVPTYNDYGIPEVLAVIRNEIAPSDVVHVGVIIGECMPSTMETVFLLRMRDPLVHAYEMTEMNELFLQYFDRFDFIVANIPHDIFFEWVTDPVLVEHLETVHAFRIAMLGDQWPMLLQRLENARNDFERIAQLGCDDRIFNIYKRVKNNDDSL